MTIQIRYDNTTTTIEVPKEDFTVMIDIDYQTRLEEAENKEAVTRRSPQEIMDDRINKPDYNNWHKFDRHRGQLKSTYCKDGETIDETDPMDKLADWSSVEGLDAQFEWEALCEKIRQALKSNYAEMIIAVHVNGMQVQEYAALLGEKPNTVSKRLQRAEKKLKSNFEKTSYSSSSQGYRVEGNSSNKTLGGNS